MADPTQFARDAIKSGVKAVLPSTSPLRVSMLEKEKRDAEQLAVDEANNLVMKRNPVALPPQALDIVDPNIPVTPAAQVASAQTAPTQQVTTREPSAVTVAQPVAPVAPSPVMGSADTGFDKIAGQMDTLQKQAEDDYKERQEFAKQKYIEVEAQLNKINENPVQLDQRSLWAKSSTGQKIVLALGALLSSVNPAGAKAFQENIQSTIDNDLKAQMDAINAQREDKKSLLSQLKSITGDIDSAAAAYKSQVYGILANKLQLTAQKAQSQRQREQAMMNYSLAAEQRDIERAKLLQTLEEKQVKGGIPGYEGQVTDPVAARAFKQSIAEKPQVVNEIDNLLKINDQFLGGALSPSARASAQQSQNLLIGKLREAIAGPGTLSETDRALLEDAIANPTDFFSLGSSNKIKLQKLKKTYENSLDANAAALGLKKVGKPASFQGK